jgi:Skp family chaperone for outer membrane proteins
MAAKSAPTHAVVVSLNRLAAESTDGKAANQKLQQLAQKMAGDLSAREKDATTKPEDMQKFRQQAQTDFNNAQRQVQTEMRSKLNPIITEIAAQHGADLVLSADTAVVWAAPKLDITAEVLTKLNEAPK